MIDFIKSPWGIVCIGVLSSIVGGALYKLIDYVIKMTAKRIRRKRFVNRLVRIGRAYGDGYTTAYAQSKSSFHQLLLIGRHGILIIASIAKAFCIALISIVMLILFQDMLIVRLIIVSVSCIVLTFSYKRIKTQIRNYNMMFDYIYGDKFKKHMMEGITHHWDEITSNNSTKEAGIKK